MKRCRNDLILCRVSRYYDTEQAGKYKMEAVKLENIWEDWHIEGKPVGAGSFGTVYKAHKLDLSLIHIFASMRTFAQRKARLRSPRERRGIMSTHVDIIP